MQVPPISAFSGMDAKSQASFRILIDYLNRQDNALQPWSRMSVLGFWATRVNMVSSAYTASDTDQIILVDSTSGTVTVTLPSAATIQGRRYTIKDWKGKSATHNITISATSPQTIDGSSTQVFSTNYQAIEVASDGANWAIISNK